jgi:thiol-disulfide isomerase/thioredoxin
MAKNTKTRRSRPRSRPVAGRMFPYVDVSTNDKNKIDKFLNMIKSGRTIIVLVYANWCGHCHTFKPIFDKAANAGNTNVAAAVESEALSTINASLPKPISVEGYPTVIAIGDKGNQMMEMNTPRGPDAVTQLTNAMKKMNSVKKPSAEVTPKTSRLNSLEETEAITVTPESVSPLPEETLLSKVITENEETDASREKEMVGGTRGGSLFTAMGAAAVQLAPTGILLGIHSLMKKRKSSKNKTKKRRSARK